MRKMTKETKQNEQIYTVSDFEKPVKQSKESVHPERFYL